jgi:hypothetical protein
MLAVQVMEAGERALGEENLEMLTSRINLASTYKNQRQ